MPNPPPKGPSTTRAATPTGSGRPPFGDITKNTNKPSGSATGNKTPTASASTGTKPKPISAAELAAQLDKAEAKWDSSTPAEKAAVYKSVFGTTTPPWAGEKSYDDGADLEYEQRLAQGKPKSG